MTEENKGTEAVTEDSSSEKTDRKIYEIGYHIVPSVQEDKLGEEVSALKDVLDKNGAIIISEEQPKMRPLSYEMRKETAGKYQKYRQAYFGWIKFEVVSEGALNIEQVFKKQPSILRYIMIRTVRENTMTVPRIPSYRRSEAPKFEEGKVAESAPKQEVSEAELNKAIDAAIAE